MKMSPAVAEAARDRIAGAKERRHQVMKAVQAGRPLDAETDETRKLDRIQAVTGVTRRFAEELARGRDPADLGLAGEPRLAAERIQGRTADFVAVSFLELARAAAACVGRVVSRDLRAQGSGFMISDRLFLTNNHVLANPNEARASLIEFNYELDFDRRPRVVARFALAPEVFYLTNPQNELDFTVVAVGERVSGTGELSDFGYCPLFDTDDKHTLGEYANVVQHPEGDYKQIVIRENRLVTRFPTVLHYIADTNPGSSGSPVFNDQWEAIALHHWGEPFAATETPEGPVPKEVNEGIRVSAIVQALQREKGRIPGAAGNLLDRALSVSFRYPSLLRAGGRVEPEAVDAAGVDRANGNRPLQPAATAGTAVWTVPLEVSVRVGTPIGPAGLPRPEPMPILEEARPSRAEKVQIDRNYSNRKGYNPRFLPDHPLELPRLDSGLRSVAARKLEVAEGEDPFELKYQHFSIAMNAERRMAFFTAANVDGSTWTNIDRDTGEPREAAEAAEKWFDDPRISAEAQTDQRLYDRQRPERVFDRGHLVRRQDPAWGTAARAVRANADTFHFTNCVPQEWNFNQRAQYWQGIENYVLDNAKAERERVTVLTGPVLAEDDPRYRDAQVPMRFWKILARVEDGELLATALMADQSERIRQMPEGLAEDFGDLGAVRQYQTSIQEVERLTGLDFGPLRDHDTFEPGPEGAAREIRSFDDLTLDLREAAARRERATGDGRRAHAHVEGDDEPPPTRKDVRGRSPKAARGREA